MLCASSSWFTVLVSSSLDFRHSSGLYQESASTKRQLQFLIGVCPQLPLYMFECPNLSRQFLFNRLPLLTIMLRLQEIILYLPSSISKSGINNFLFSLYFILVFNFKTKFAKVMHTCSSWETRKMALLQFWRP